MIVDRIALFYGEKAVCVLLAKCELVSLLVGGGCWGVSSINIKALWGRTFIHSNKSCSLSQWMFELDTASGTGGMHSTLPVTFCISLKNLPQLEKTVSCITYSHLSKSLSYWDTEYGFWLEFIGWCYWKQKEKEIVFSQGENQIKHDWNNHQDQYCWLEGKKILC